MATTSTLRSLILRVTRKTKKGLTVGEIFDRVQKASTPVNQHYSSVRARVYELAASGALRNDGFRKDSVSNRVAGTFTRN